MLRLARLLALILLVPVSAFAASQDITLTAIVPETCIITPTQSPSHTLTIDSTNKVVTTPVTFSFPVACNSPATMSLSSTSTGLVGPAAAAGFENKINYRVVTGGLFEPLTFDTLIPAAPLPDGGNPYAKTSTEPLQGTLTIGVTPAPNASPLAAGTYTDTLRVTILPKQ